MGTGKRTFNDLFDAVIEIKGSLGIINERCVNEKKAISDLQAEVYGTESKDGIKITTDRNTRWIMLMNWIYGAIFTGVVLVIVAAMVIEHFSKMPKP